MRLLRHSRKAQVAEWMIWIPRIAFVIIIVLLLSLARENLLATKTSIDQAELPLLGLRLLQQLPEDFRFDAGTFAQAQNAFDHIKYNGAETGARLRLVTGPKTRVLYWQETAYNNLAVISATTVFRQTTRSITQTFPAQYNGEPSTLILEVIQHA